MDDDNEVSKILSDCIEKSGLSLFKIACEMSELLGSEISKTRIPKVFISAMPSGGCGK